METKPSVYTWEFWLTVIAQVFFTLNTTHAWTYMPARWSGIIQAAILVGFQLSRGIAKSGTFPDASVPANTKLVPKKRDLHARR